MKYRLTVSNRMWKLERFLTQQECWDLSYELRKEGIHSDATWWFARGEENPNGYWDTESHDDVNPPWWCDNPALKDVRSRLSPHQQDIAIGYKHGSFAIEYTIKQEANDERTSKK